MPHGQKHQGVIVLYEGAIARVFEGEIHHELDASGGHDFWTWSSLEREDSAFRYRVALSMPKMGARDHCCPFCAGIDVVVSNKAPMISDWTVECLNCEAQGPRSPTEKEAMRRWDSLIHRPNGQ